MANFNINEKANKSIEIYRKVEIYRIIYYFTGPITSPLSTGQMSLGISLEDATLPKEGEDIHDICSPLCLSIP